jgi:hypothetical protein
VRQYSTPAPSGAFLVNVATKPNFRLYKEKGDSKNLGASIAPVLFLRTYFSDKEKLIIISFNAKKYYFDEIWGGI